MAEDHLSLKEFEQGQYEKLGPLLEEARHRTPDELIWKIDELFSPEVQRDLSRTLERWGIHKTALYKTGCYALILKTTDNQLVRIGYSNDHDFPEYSVPTDLYEVLQPLKSRQIGSFRVELLPEVRVIDRRYEWSEEGERRVKDALALVKSAAQKGYFLFDPSPLNIGYTRNNIPVVLDRGALIPFNAIEGELTSQLSWRRFCEFFRPNAAHVLKHELPALMDQYWQSIRFRNVDLPTYDYEAAQKDHLRELGLQSNKVVGTRSGQLARYLDEEPGEGKKPLGSTVARMRLARNLEIKNPGEFVAAAKESGGYDKVTAERLRKSRKPVPGFLDRVTQQNDEPRSAHN